MEDEKLADKLLDRILMVLMPYDQIDVERIKAKLTVVLDDYQICPKQEALVVYTEGKNDYYLRKFLLAKAVAGRQERTLRQYKDEVGRALRGIGKDADTITADDIQVYLAKVLSRGGSKCYCDNIRRDLSSFYNWLYREEIIRTNPMNKIDNIKFKREKEKALTDMEIEMMRQACQTTMQKAIMEMLLSTGCRAAELVSIKIADMDEDKVSILGKGGKWRTVYINAKAFVAVKNYLADRKDINPYLFPREINTKDRTMISNFSRKDWFKDPRLVTKADHFGRDSVNNMVRTIGKRAGVKGVHLKEFWTWAEKNRSFLDFSKLEPLAFGEEPAWVAEQRKRDFKACSLQRKDPWTPAEDAKLRMLLEQYKYTYEQMSDMLRRSPGAIQRRCADLGLKARPVRINPHGPEAVWHQEDYDRLAEGIKSGESYMSISKALGKSEKAIRGKVYYCYLTENADKVRAMMAGGNWSDGAPEPTVWQARLLSRSRAEMQTTMTMLVEALNCRIQQVGYDPALEDHWNQYWQRTTCLHWDDLKHCTAGCTDCDSCAEYKKIPPQYCARCGATFYERKENTFCLQCRFDRKKQEQRHWCRVNAKRGERQ